jgi:hypothetical protein
MDFPRLLLRITRPSLGLQSDVGQSVPEPATIRMRVRHISGSVSRIACATSSFSLTISSGGGGSNIGCLQLLRRGYANVPPLPWVHVVEIMNGHADEATATERFRASRVRNAPDEPEEKAQAESLVRRILRSSGIKSLPTLLLTM